VLIGVRVVEPTQRLLTIKRSEPGPVVFACFNFIT
jgi:hypothetical protein